MVFKNTIIFYLNKKGENMVGNENMVENENIIKEMKKINYLLEHLMIKYTVLYILVGYIIVSLLGVIIGLFIGYIKVP